MSLHQPQPLPKAQDGSQQPRDQEESSMLETALPSSMLNILTSIPAPHAMLKMPVIPVTEPAPVPTVTPAPPAPYSEAQEKEA